MAATGSRQPLVCPLCHVVETTPEFDDPRGPARLHPLVRCRRCGLVFQQFLPELPDLEEGQRDAYGRPGARFTRLIEAAIRIFRMSRVRLVQRILPRRGRVLDVGCGRGLFLHMLRKRGFDVRGTELSRSTAENALPGVPIDVGELAPGRYPDDTFDLVAIWHVLEHLRFPDRVIAGCAEALKPGGVLLIAVPNYESVQARLGGELWFHLDLPRHLFHFAPATLRRLLEQHGFGIERIRTGQWEMDPFGLLQTALNRVGLRHNALYDTLRNQPRAKEDLSRAYRLLMLVLFPIGLLLAAPLSLLFRLMGRGGTLIVLARRGGVGEDSEA